MSGVVLAVVFGIFRSEIVSLLGATDTSQELAEQYGIYIMMGAPVMCGAYVLNNALRAEGQPYLALMGIVAGGATNAVLDYVLIKVLGFGIGAAGIATFAGQAVSLVIMYACVRARFSMVRLHIGDLWKFKGCSAGRQDRYAFFPETRTYVRCGCFAEPELSAVWGHSACQYNCGK